MRVPPRNQHTNTAALGGEREVKHNYQSRHKHLREGGGGDALTPQRLCHYQSFYCSGKRRVARQAKDHPEGLPTAWHTTWRSPFREKSGPGGQAHLHTTLNKSRDEKLDLAGTGCGNGSGKRPGVIGSGARLPDGRCAQCLSAGKRRLHLGSNQGPIG